VATITATSKFRLTIRHSFVLVESGSPNPIDVIRLERRPTRPSRALHDLVQQKKTNGVPVTSHRKRAESLLAIENASPLGMSPDPLPAPVPLDRNGRDSANITETGQASLMDPANSVISARTSARVGQ
jgi:hypothetical protein